MKSSIPVLVAFVLCGTASPAAAQRVTQLRLPSPLEAPAVVDGSLSMEDTVRLEPRSLHVTAPDDARWNAAFLGAVAGAVAGGLVGVWAEKDSQDAIAPPAYYFSVPLGAVVGFVVGMHLRGR